MFGSSILMHQVVDLSPITPAIWESLSIHHSRNVWYRLQRATGQLWTQLRRPILT